MTDIKLTWDNRTTDAVSQKIYRSLEEFDSSNLPAVHAEVDFWIKEYLDEDVIEDAYWYMLSTVTEDDELFSDCVRIEKGEAGECDPHWDSVVALLHFDGSLDDERGAIWTEPGSLYEPGLFGQAARLSNTMHRGIDLGTQDFTVDIAYLGSLAGTSWPYPEIISLGSLSWGPGYLGLYTNRNDTGNKVSIYVYGKPTIIAAIDINDGQFRKISIQRRGNDLDLYIDGIKQGSMDVSGVSFSGSFRITGSGRNAINCLVDELRITKGVARYTENFTPPTNPFPNC